MNARLASDEEERFDSGRMMKIKKKIKRLIIKLMRKKHGKKIKHKPNSLIKRVI